MVVKVLGVIEVEGSEIECALYTHCLVQLFRLQTEHDKKKEVDAWLKKYGDMTFEDLMKMERDEEE